MKQIFINGRSSGKYRVETIGGREHLVTRMMPIMGGTAMNRIYYPDEAVTETFNQLNMLTAPVGHPSVNGVDAPALHPVAYNKHNVGGFLRNPVKKGPRVFCDFCLDVTVANSTDAGRELINKIKSGQKIGVSTGLTISNVRAETGVDRFGKPYDHVGTGYKFDHVAILLNEVAAGEHAGTELVFNEAGDTAAVFALTNEPLNAAELLSALNAAIQPSDNVTTAWVSDVLIDKSIVVYNSQDDKGQRTEHKRAYAVDILGELSLIDDKPVQKQNSTTNPTEPKEANKLDIKIGDLVSAIIATNSNKYTYRDVAALNAMQPVDLLAIVATNVDDNQAKSIVTNAGFDFAAYDKFVANKDDFTAWQVEQQKASDALVTEIVKNSDFYTVENLKGKPVSELNALHSLVTNAGKTATGLGEGMPHKVTNSQTAANQDIEDWGDE